MAVTFTAASLEYLEIASALVSAAPLTMAAWIKPVSVTAVSGWILNIGESPVVDDFLLYHNADKVAAFTRNVAGAEANSTGSLTAGAWNHACAVFAAANDRRAYRDGGNKGTEATSITPGAMTHTSIGRTVAGIGYFNGDIAEVALWNVALDDSEVAALGKGFCPLLIRPTSLVAYWPLNRNSFNKGGGTTTLDRWKNRHDLTEGNTPTLAEHPRIIMPQGAF